MRQQKRALIVTSSYAPAMIADMHRARLLAWELPRVGWDVEILTPGAAFQHPSCVESDCGSFFFPETPVHYVEEWVPKLFSAIKVRSIGWRALAPLYAHGVHLLRKRHFDLVLFSTTQFMFFLLGPIWKRLFGIPYMLDFHDPWRRDCTVYITTPHWWKLRVSGILAGTFEKWAVSGAAGLVAVSPKYILELKKRYNQKQPVWMAPQRHRVIPFGASARDLEEAGSARKSVVKDHSGWLRLVYVGAGGAIMARSFALICRSLAALREKGNAHAHRLRIELYGTMYGWREGDPKPLQQIAIAQGVGHMVIELPQRVSYRRSLELLLEADGVLILGVDDEGYMPSKLFTYALSGKPLLASLHHSSPAYEQFCRGPELGHALWFDAGNEIPIDEAMKQLAAFLEEAAAGNSFDRRNLVAPFLASAMARHFGEIFEACISVPSRILTHEHCVRSSHWQS